MFKILKVCLCTPHHEFIHFTTPHVNIYIQLEIIISCNLPAPRSQLKKTKRRTVLACCDHYHCRSFRLSLSPIHIDAIRSGDNIESPVFLLRQLHNSLWGILNFHNGFLCIWRRCERCRDTCLGVLHYRKQSIYYGKWALVFSG